MKYAKFDMAKIITENVNIMPERNFNHPDEMFYYIENLRTRMSEENIDKCLDGFLYF